MNVDKTRERGDSYPPAHKYLHLHTVPHSLHHQDNHSAKISNSSFRIKRNLSNNDDDVISQQDVIIKDGKTDQVS